MLADSGLGGLLRAVWTVNGMKSLLAESCWLQSTRNAGGQWAWRNVESCVDDELAGC
jgi:hypothetical protein